MAPMTPPSNIPGSHASAAPAGLPDRVLRTLMSLVEDLTVAREEEGLLRATLEHAVDGLDLAGGLTLLFGPDDRLVGSAEHHFEPGLAAAEDLAAACLGRGAPLVNEISGGGWLAATPLRAR